MKLSKTRKISKGSSSILIAMCLLVIIPSMALMLRYSFKSADRSSFDGVCQLGMSSMLSSYSKQLLRDYHILAFGNQENITSKNFEKDLNVFLKNRKGIKLEDIDIRYRDYSLLNLEVFRDLIGLYIPDNILESKHNKLYIAGDDKIKNKDILELLPSKEADCSRIDIPFKSVFNDNFFDNLSQSGYIFTHFNHRGVKDFDSSRNLLREEIEYILSGETSDRENESDVERRIREIRTIINGAIIYKDPEKMDLLRVAALSIDAGNYKEIVAVLLVAWAYAEARADMNHLREGKGIPWKKTDADWHTSINLNGDSYNMEESNTSDSQARCGYYEDYLKILLTLLDEDTKFYRMMDIIQMNMKLRYSKDFLIKDYYTGLFLDVETNIGDFKYERTY